MSARKEYLVEMPVYTGFAANKVIIYLYARDVEGIIVVYVQLGSRRLGRVEVPTRAVHLMGVKIAVTRPGVYKLLRNPSSYSDSEIKELFLRMLQDGPELQRLIDRAIKLRDGIQKSFKRKVRDVRVSASHLDAIDAAQELGMSVSYDLQAVTDAGPWASNNIVRVKPNDGDKFFISADQSQLERFLRQVNKSSMKEAMNASQVVESYLTEMPVHISRDPARSVMQITLWAKGLRTSVRFGGEAWGTVDTKIPPTWANEREHGFPRHTWVDGATFEARSPGEYKASKATPAADVKEFVGVFLPHNPQLQRLIDRVWKLRSSMVKSHRPARKAYTDASLLDAIDKANELGVKVGMQRTAVMSDYTIKLYTGDNRTCYVCADSQVEIDRYLRYLTQSSLKSE